MKPGTTTETAGGMWHDADDIRWATRHWAARIGVPLRGLHLRLLRTKWASISTAGRMTLNTELLAAPRALGEYVIVHELVHLLCPDSGHGRLFQSFLAAYLPDWHDRQKRLDAWEQGRAPRAAARKGSVIR